MLLMILNVQSKQQNFFLHQFFSKYAICHEHKVSSRDEVTRHDDRQSVKVD